jgi:hypothetical protein
VGVVVRAILSDVHGNLEALQAVLADAIGNGVREILCLGDMVGYGPSPLECITLSTSWSVALLGAHDLAALWEDDLPGWSARYAAQSVFWCRDLLQASTEALELRAGARTPP